MTQTITSRSPENWGFIYVFRGGGGGSLRLALAMQINETATTIIITIINQSINQSINLYRAYRGACYSAVMPNQREMS